MSPEEMKSKEIRKVLLFRLGGLGDTLIALPSIRLVRRAFPEAKITALTNLAGNTLGVGMASLLDGMGLVDNYIYYPVKLRDPVALYGLRKRIVQEKFDCLVYLSTPHVPLARTTRDALYFLSCGITRQIGVPYAKAARCVQPIEGTDRYQSEYERLASNIRCLGDARLDDDASWDLQLTESEDDEARELLTAAIGGKPFLAFCAGTKYQPQDWTEPNWAAFLSALGERQPDLGLIALGGPYDSEMSDRLLSRWQGPRANLCGGPAARVSAAILRRAEVFVGHDSGPMHIAASVGTACVAIFSARNQPGIWFPRGDNHEVLYRKTECAGCLLWICEKEQKKCILSIRPDEVVRAVESKLAERVSRVGVI